MRTITKLILTAMLFAGITRYSAAQRLASYVEIRGPKSLLASSPSQTFPTEHYNIYFWTQEGGNGQPVAPPSEGYVIEVIWNVTGNNTFQNKENFACDVTWSEIGTHDLHYEIQSWDNYLIGDTEVKVAEDPVPYLYGPSSVTSNSFVAGWSTVPAANSYRVDVSTSSTFGSFLPGFNNLSVSGNQISVTGLSPGVIYYYRVRSVIGSVVSASSNGWAIYTIPSIPTATSATNVTTNSFNANWNGVPGTGYKIDVSTTENFQTILSAYNGLSVSSNNKVVTGLSSGATYYYRVRTVNGTAMSSYSNIVAVTTIPIAIPSPVALPASSITYRSFTANWNAVSGATGYQIDISPSSSFDSFLVTYNNYLTSGTSLRVEYSAAAGTHYYYRVRAVTSSGTSPNSNVIHFVTVPGAPNIYSPQDITSNSFKARWSTGGAATEYYLVDLSTNEEFTDYVNGYHDYRTEQSSLSIAGLNKRANYYIRVRAANISGVSVYSLAELQVSYDMNSTQSTEVRIPLITSVSQIESAGIYDVFTQYDYYDAFGRPIQKVSKGQSPSGKDIIQSTSYDLFGRPNKTYLPYTSESNGFYKLHALKAFPTPTSADTEEKQYKTGEQYAFYQKGGLLASDEKPYSESIFDTSPFNRVLKQGAEGMAWQPNPDESFNAADHTQKYAYEINSGNEVLQWTYLAPDEAYPLGLLGTSNGTDLSYYAQKELYKNSIRDENSNIIIQYKDRDGNVVLKRVQASVNEWADTYYIYDDYNNLAIVLQPEAVKAIVSDPSSYFSLTNADKDLFLGRLAFRYTYDDRNRMDQRQVPGAAPVYLVYDHRDRLILIQDGNQRNGATKYWTYTKYDAMNRPILTGIKDTTAALTQDNMQAVVNDFYNQKSWSRLYDEYTGTSGIAHGYTNKSYPVVNSGATLDINRFLTVSYYDNYDFAASWGDIYSYHTDNLSETTINNTKYDQKSTLCCGTTGLLTGKKVKVMDGGISGGNTWLRSVSYYDDRYQVIQNVADNYKGGVDRISNLYDFTGKILKTKSTHQQADVTQWKDIVGVSIIGNKIIRTATGSSWGQSGLASVDYLPASTNGWVQFKASEENTARMLGLSETNVNANYTTIGYALYLRNDKTLWIYEGGTSKAQISNGYKTGDVFRIQRTGTKIQYFQNGIDITPNVAQTASSAPLYIDIAIGTSLGTLSEVSSSFTSGIRTVEKRFVYDHAGRLTHGYLTLDGQAEVELTGNEYNELGQLADKKLHSVSGGPYKQSVDYRYNIRGWLTGINDSELTENENDYFGMNLAYNEEQGTGNSEFTTGTTNQIGSYSFTGNADDASPKVLNGSVVSTAALTMDNLGNANQAYAFDGTGYIEIPNSKTEHAFIQNTGEFTIAAFLKLNDLSARSVILSNTATSLYKGFLFMYETYGGTAGDHQLRLTITNGQSGTSTINLGAKNTINDTNWHHVAVVGDGSYIRFYVDGVLDGTPTPITIKSSGDANYTTFIGKSRTTNGAGFLGLNGALDELNIFNRALSPKEIQALTLRAQPGVKQTSGGQFNGNISGIKWSVNQGLSDVKEMAYTFDYDPMNRLSEASHLQAGSSHIWQSGKFHEGGLQYDLNGNIKNLVRYGDSGMQDNLTYNYGAIGVTGNRLLKVTDASNKFTGFIDGVNITDDYGYDANGNMATDLNKGISTAISYNFLNLPELVTRGVGTVRYIYDAGGRKLAQIVTSGTQTKRTDYVGEFQYEDDVLQFINHEEGRIVVTNPELVYSLDGSSVNPITTVDATVATLTANGDQTYVLARATSANARAGMFPIGGAFPVQPGERYKIRVRGYRDKGSVATSNAAYIVAQANGADIAWPGAALQGSATTEAWVEQIITIPAGATELKAGVIWGTVAAGNTIYLNDFEITKLNITEPEYQYFIKDHLGNVRVTFTTKEETETAMATLEDESMADEQSKFIYYNEAIRVYSNIFDHTNNGESLPSGPPWGDPDAPVQDTPGYSTLLRGGENERYGLAKSLSVMPGDVINMEVYAKYPDPDDEYWSDELRTLLESIAPGGNPSPGTIIDGGAAGSIGNMTFPFAGWLSHTENEDNGPKAYLNWLVFDRNYKQLDGGYVKVSTLAAQSSINNLHEQLTHSLVVKEPGYVYIYLSNESETPVDVFFDDFKVEQIKNPVIHTEDYYPFGLTYNSYQRENSLAQLYRFGSKEKQDELGLNWLDFGARMYQPEIGRWGTLDPHADTYEITTPYNYAFNNPMLFVDPNGKDNMIYLIMAGKFDPKLALQILGKANEALANLGLETRVTLFYGNNFDPGNLDPTDNWAVIGNNRHEISEKVNEIDRFSVLSGKVSEWTDVSGENSNNAHNFEMANAAAGGMGIAIDHVLGNIGTHQSNSNPDAIGGSALGIMHAAAHSSSVIKGTGERGKPGLGQSDGHTKHRPGIMLPGGGGGVALDDYGLIEEYRSAGFNGIVSPTRKFFNGEVLNDPYIKAMKQRYGTNPSQDNYQRNKERREKQQLYNWPPRLD